MGRFGSSMRTLYLSNLYTSLWTNREQHDKEANYKFKFLLSDREGCQFLVSLSFNEDHVANPINQNYINSKNRAKLLAYETSGEYIASWASHKLNSDKLTKTDTQQVLFSEKCIMLRIENKCPKFTKNRQSR